MKKISIILLLFSLSTLLIAQQRGFKGLNIQINGKTTTLYTQSHALIIGVSNYTNGWSDLPGVSRDIQSVKQTLEKHDFNVTVVENPDSKGLKKAFDSFISKYSRDFNSRLLIFFSGHGYTMKQQWGGEMGYIIPSDAPNPHSDPEGFKDKAINMEMMEVYAKRMDSKHALFMFDCCFSGSIFSLSKAAPAIINYKTSKPVRQFITAGGADEEVPDESIFCRQFTVGLDGEADVNRDGYISGSELGEYLQTSVVNYSYEAQHPQYGKIRNPKLDKGDFVFVLNTNNNVPAKTSPVISIKEEIKAATGSVKIIAGFAGKLSWEHGFLKDVKANSIITLDDVPVGKHVFNLLGKPGEMQEISKQISTVYENQITEVFMRIPKKPESKKRTNTTASIPKKQYNNMVYVKGGTFEMGNNNGRPSEKPAHKVTLNGFYIDIYETTIANFKRFVNATGYKTDVENRGYTRIRRSGKVGKKVNGVSWRSNVKGKDRPLTESNHPAVFLSKKDAEEYCKWRGGRLPTEAEWEYAARGGSTSSPTKYAGSNNINEVGWYSENSGKTTHAVGQKKPNELGVYDMSGNVWEFCSDLYDCENNYYDNSPVNNPTGPSRANHKVARGGSWYYNSNFARITDRSGWQLFGNSDTGVRCVREK